MKTTRTFLRDCTVVSPMALLLFGGALAVLHEAGLVRQRACANSHVRSVVEPPTTWHQAQKSSVPCRVAEILAFFLSWVLSHQVCCAQLIPVQIALRYVRGHACMHAEGLCVEELSGMLCVFLLHVFLPGLFVQEFSCRSLLATFDRSG